jgi:hypothetical protein
VYCAITELVPITRPAPDARRCGSAALGQAEARHQVDLQHPAEELGRRVHRAVTAVGHAFRGLAADAGVVEQDVELAEELERPTDDPLRRVVRGDVLRQDLDALATCVLGGQPLARQIDRQHLRPVLREQLRRRGADSRRGPGDDGRAAFQQLHDSARP